MYKMSKYCPCKERGLMVDERKRETKQKEPSVVEDHQSWDEGGGEQQGLIFNFHLNHVFSPFLPTHTHNRATHRNPACIIAGIYTSLHLSLVLQLGWFSLVHPLVDA